MKEKRSWWLQIKQHWVAIGVAAIVFVVVIALIIAGYWFDWTGFNGYNKVTITHTISGTSAGTVTRTEEYQPGKALWDWLGLLAALAIPIVVGFGAAWFTAKQTQASEARNKQQHETELQIATDNQREVALQAYIDKISELLLANDLRESAEDNEVRTIARVRTLTVLSGLDAIRKASVLQFLHESGLIDKGKRIISLSGADLREANLSDDNLSGADLSGAYLSGANLSRADLTDANLRGAYLMGAYLSGTTLGHADLSGADLRGAYLSGAELTDANLRDALLGGATLGVANLSGADLSGANLSDANLSNANLSNANLSGAYLGGANLNFADLSHADLSGANLSGANLSNAKVTEEQLTQAKSLKGATMPDGSIHP